MKNIIFKQIWLAFKIWVIALSLNTIGGSLLLTGRLDKDVMKYGLIYATILSFPIFCILLIVIHHCVSRRKGGLQLFRYLLITGLALTLCSFALFSWWMNLIVPAGLAIIPLLASGTALLSQYGACFRLTDYDKKLEKFLL